MIEQATSFITEYRELIALAIAFIFAIIEIVRERMKARDALTLLFNILKDESKMDGHKMVEATMEKLEQVSKVQKVGRDVKEEVANVIEKPREGLQVGSYKGKPVYIQDVGKVTSTIGSGIAAIKGIFKL